MPLRTSSALTTLIAGGLALTLAGCGKPQPKPQMGPPEVGVVTLQPQAATLTTTLPGRTSPYAVSDVRPQVNGIIQARLFQEGSNVHAGQVLYQIDPATYRAAYNQALAQLTSAQANVVTAKAKSERYEDLVKINGVSKQDADDAKAAYLQAVAAVQQNQAAVQSAKINLDYTAVKAPISGRAGVSAYTKGALVTAGQTNALTTVQTLDPIYVDINQSAAELLKLRQAMSDGALSSGPTSAEVSLQLEDGSAYPWKGKLEFADVTVDQTTGAVTLRAIFPNPKGVLLPGLYVRALIVQGVKSSAILAPQQGVTRDEGGNPTAMVVNAQGKAESRRLKVERTVGDKWLVSSGLQAGDKLIVEGLQRVKPGAAVHAVPAGSAPAAPQQPAAQH